MSVELGTGYINLVASARGIAASALKELSPVTDTAQTVGEQAGKNLAAGLLGNVSGTGKKLVEALGLAAVSAFAIKSAVDVEDANNIIARSTGATGKALDGLQQSFRNVASTTGASFETVATTLAQLSQRTGLTGKALEGLTSQVVTFNRISKDSPITVEALTTALSGFNVPGKEMGAVLDRLFQISQKTGVPLASILDTLQTAGPVARQFGFSVEFTATLLSQLNKAGLDANQILPGLRTAFVNFAKAGENPAEGLRKTLGAINDLIKAGDVAGARQLAVQIFGARGAGLVDAAIAGKLSIEQLGTSITTSGSGILDTAGKTGTLAGALGTLRNIAKLAFSEFATPAIEAANQALRGLLPTIRAAGDEFAQLPDGVKLSIAGVLGLVALAGPLGQFGQGIQGLQSVVSAVGTGFQLAAVRGLELAESLKAVTLAGALTTSALTLGFAAIAAGLVVIFTASERLTPGLKAAEDRGKSFASTFVAGAKTSANELATLQQGLSNVDAAMKRINESDVGPILRSGSQELIVENDAARAAQIQLRELGAEHDVLSKRIDAVKKALADQAAQDQATKASLDTYNNSVTAGASAAGAFADLTDAAKKAIEDFQAAELAAAGGDIGRQQALINIQKAQDDAVAAVLARLDAETKLHDAQVTFGPESQQAIDATTHLTQAQRDERSANLDLQQAQLQGVQATDALDKATNDLITGILNGTISYDAQRAALLQQIALHPENAAGYQLEIDKLDDAKRRIDGLAGFVADASVNVTVRGLGQVQALIDAFHAIPGNANITVDPYVPILPHALGGIFTRPTVGLFAEAGAEAILPLNDPRRAWELIAQSGLLDSMPAATQGPAGGAGINFNGPVSFGDKDVISDLEFWRLTRLVGA
jgi:phage-related minor tail protein